MRPLPMLSRDTVAPRIKEVPQPGESPDDRNVIAVLMKREVTLYRRFTRQLQSTLALHTSYNANLQLCLQLTS